jgi:hypothetical protein
VSAAAVAAFDAGVAGALRGDAAISVIVLPSRTLEGDAPTPLCRSWSCLKDLAARSGADFFVRGAIRPLAEGRPGHVAELEVIRPSPMAVVASSEFACNNCIPDLLGQQASGETASLMARLRATIVAGASRPLPAAPAADRPPGSGLALTFILAAGAVAGVGVGTTLLALDGKSTCSELSAKDCPRNLNLTVPGAVSLGAGLAAGIAAFLVHKAHLPPPPLAVAVGPGTLVLRGAF